MIEFNNLTVLLSACGAQFAPGLMKCLKENGEREIRVIGIDMHYDPTLDGLYDGIYEVPAASDPSTSIMAFLSFWSGVGPVFCMMGSIQHFRKTISGNLFSSSL